MKQMERIKRIVTATVAAALLSIGSLASATVISGASDAYNAKVDLSAALGLVNVQVGPLNAAGAKASFFGGG